MPTRSERILISVWHGKARRRASVVAARAGEMDVEGTLAVIETAFEGGGVFKLFTGEDSAFGGA